MIIIGLYWSFGREIRRARNREIATLAAAIMVFALIRGLVDTERFDINYPVWLITLFILAWQPLPRSCDERAALYDRDSFVQPGEVSRRVHVERGIARIRTS